MGAVGDSSDNAVAESFFATLKGEVSDRCPWPTASLARAAISRTSEGWYNRRRRHSTLGYLSPADLRARLGRRDG